MKLNNKYDELFINEENELNNQYDKTEELYNETHKALDKNILRMESKTMIGTTSPYRDISELSKTLTGIRQTSVNITKEKINLKKIKVELELKEKQTATNSQNAQTSETMLRDIVTSIGIKEAFMKNTKTSNKGIENLKNLDIEDIGINENDLKMIEAYKKSDGKRSFNK